MKKKSEFKDANAPATRKQTWAIFCMTKEDVREVGLTRYEASQIISTLKDGGEFVLPKRVRGELKVDKVIKPFTVRKGDKPKPEKKDYRKIFFEAVAAGTKAMEDCRPTPMVVQQHANMLDDNSPVVQEWHVAGGPCGFASVHMKCKGEAGKFINYLKKKGLASADENNFTAQWKKDGYRGGYYYWVSDGGQSLAYKEAFARAMVKKLGEYGIDCYMTSRMD